MPSSLGKREQTNLRALPQHRKWRELKAFPFAAFVIGSMYSLVGNALRGESHNPTLNNGLISLTLLSQRFLEILN